MRIAVLSPFEETVPPRKYGGTELVVFNLVEELVALGHDVTLFASGDSQTSAQLFPVFETNLRNMPEGKNAKLRDCMKHVGIGKVIEKLLCEEYDLVHNHIGWRIMPFEKCIPAPLVTTLHGNLGDPGHASMYKYYSQTAYVSISNSQRRPAPELNYVATVYNGIDCSAFAWDDEPDDYFAFLGRFSPEKGAVEAIQAAREAGVRLIMAAKVDLVDSDYYEQRVKPLVDGDQIQYIGEVDHYGKNELLRKARGLLMPINWDEPFGLVMAESLASGCPVIANRRGSVPEVIQDDVGYITQSHEEIVSGIREIGKISRRRCREYVCQHFERAVMAAEYVKAYEKVASEQMRLQY
jgi:glycosyltransferase involved in cell wall biosynthesis